MNKEYVTKFIEANEEMVFMTIDELSNFKGDLEKMDTLIKKYDRCATHHLTALEQLIELEKAEEQMELDNAKRLNDLDIQIQQVRNDLYNGVGNLVKDTVLQFSSMIFYKSIFREGLLFETENTVSSGFVRGVTTKLSDFMKIKK